MTQETLFLEDIARLIGKTPKTVRYDMCRHPERIPPSFRMPGSRKPIWLRSTVEAFLRAQAHKHGALEDGEAA